MDASNVTTRTRRARGGADRPRVRPRDIERDATTTTRPSSHLPTLGFVDTLRVLGQVVMPTVAKGVIIRRPRVVAFVAMLDLDRHALRCLQHIRARYGTGPVILRLPGRREAIVLDSRDAQRVLAETPDPFATDSSEKHAALAHFQPHGVLISRGATRAVRRRFNDAVLESDCPRHHLAGRFASVVNDEAAGMLRAARTKGTLDWSAFTSGWHRAVRRVVLGDAARNDRELTDLLARLRADANWAFMRPKREALRETFMRRLRAYVRLADPGSIASMMCAMPIATGTDAVGQIPQWLFAFDSAGIATFRTLALLATHEAQRERARREIGTTTDDSAPTLPYLRACLLDAVRLWPTTPAILRQTSAPTHWGAAVLPENAGVLIYTPFFHRDDTRLPFANRFAPEIWLDGRPETEWGLIPFSDGPAMCPGRELVLLMGSIMLAALLRDGSAVLRRGARLDPARPLPGTLNNFALEFGIENHSSRIAAAPMS